ncbi:hypothetical protein AB0L67_40270 [Streptomyces flaveolus]|uniref:hypothetical protein n=1 Tax=Streptomyces flaveolus TaxID=67297 RepID=UPI00341BEDDA
MTDVDTGSPDRLAVAVLAQYRMATTEQMHLILSPDVPIEQTRRRLVKHDAKPGQVSPIRAAVPCGSWGDYVVITPGTTGTGTNLV